MDNQPLCATHSPQPAAPSAGPLHPHRLLGQPLHAPRYLPTAAYYGHLGDNVRWALRLYARLVALTRQLFPDQLPLYTHFNPLDSSDMDAAIAWLHQLAHERLFPVIDMAADDGYYDVDNGDLPDTLIWLTPQVIGVTYDVDYCPYPYDEDSAGAFGLGGAVDFLMALAAADVSEVNPYDADQIPDTPFGIIRHHYGCAPPAGFALRAALQGLGNITLPPPYDTALPLLVRIVLKQTGNTFFDSGPEELWETTIEWDDDAAIRRLAREYTQVPPWLATIRQFNAYHDQDRTTVQHTILSLLTQAWRIGQGQLVLLPHCI